MKNVKTKILSISVFLLSIYFLSIVSASQSYFYMPDGMSVEQFQQLVKDANGDKGNFLSVIFGSGFQLTSIACHDTFPYNCYWGSFTSTNPLGNGGCSSSDAPSNCIISPDSVSSTACNGKTSDQCCVIARTNYNSDLINLQCYCNPRQTGCSGGGTSGDRKCSGSSVFQCNSNGAWDYVTNCANGCSGAGSCNSQPQCTPHASSRCEGNTVYWYDSCGSQEEPKLQCGSNEQCSNGNCQQVCTEQPIGATFCVGNSVKQQYQKSDCSVENRDVITCTSTQTCSNGICREQSCPTCLADGQFSSCVNGKMSRTISICDSSTSYQCQTRTDEKNCDCTDDSTCGYDETCNNYVCTKLQCQEGEVAQVHECTTTSSLWIWIIIGVAVVIFIGIMIFVAVMISKSTRRKRYGG